MNGVEILNQIEVVTETTCNWSAFWIGVGIGLIVALVAATVFGLDEQSWGAFFTMLGVAGVLISLMMGFLCGCVIDPAPTEYETHYEVIVDDTVNMKEFMNTYDIVETRGAIYVVREKIND